MLDLGDQTGNVALEPEAKGLDRGRRDGLLAARRAHTAATRSPPASHAAPSPGRLAISDDHTGVDVIVGLQPLHERRHMRSAQIHHEIHVQRRARGAGDGAAHSVVDPSASNASATGSSAALISSVIGAPRGSAARGRRALRHRAAPPSAAARPVRRARDVGGQSRVETPGSRRATGSGREWHDARSRFPEQIQLHRFDGRRSIGWAHAANVAGPTLEWSVAFCAIRGWHHGAAPHLGGRVRVRR